MPESSRQDTPTGAPGNKSTPSHTPEPRRRAYIYEASYYDESLDDSEEAFHAEYFNSLREAKQFLGAIRVAFKGRGDNFDGKIDRWRPDGDLSERELLLAVLNGRRYVDGRERIFAVKDDNETALEGLS